MRELWHEWISDNPFVIRELHRWRRRGALRRALLFGAGMPALVLLALHGAAYAFASQTLPPPAYGAIFLAGVLATVLGMFGYDDSRAWKLTAAAKSGQLEFLRLLPMDGFTFVLKVTVARAVVVTPSLLAALPVYLSLLAYGGVYLADILAVYSLHALLLWGSAVPAEVTESFHAEPRPSLSTRTQGRRVSLAGEFFGRTLSILIGAVIVALLTAGSFVALQMLLGMVPPRTPPGWPFSPTLATVQLLWSPQPFFQWSLIPFPPLAALWIAARISSLYTASETWTDRPPKEGEVRPLAQRSDRLDRVSGIAVMVLAAGFLWRPAVESGWLGRFAGDFRPPGATSVLLYVLGGFGAILVMESLRHGHRKDVGPAALAKIYTVPTGFALTICTLGGLWPPAASVGTHALGLAAAVVFAFGWRHVFQVERKLELAIADPSCGSCLFTLAGYMLPLAALIPPEAPQALHLAAAHSPIYALLAALSGVWGARAPLPVPTAAAVAAATGLALLALSRLTQRLVQPPPEPPPELPPLPRRFPRDPSWLRPLAPRLRAWDLDFQHRLRAWDNPLFTLRTRQPRTRRLRRFHLSRRVVHTTAGLLAWTTGLYVALIAGMALWTGWTWGMDRALNRLVALFRPGGMFGLPTAQFIALAFAVVLLAVVFLVLSNSTSAAANEYTQAKKANRLLPLLLSPLPDEEIVWGIMGAELTNTVPPVIAETVGSLVWMVVAVLLGAPPWALLVWAWAATLALALGFAGGFGGFGAWGGTDTGCLGSVVILALALGLAWFASVSLPVLLLVLVLALAAAAARVPRSIRSAVAAIHRCRQPGALERLLNDPIEASAKPAVIVDDEDE